MNCYYKICLTSYFHIFTDKLHTFMMLDVEVNSPGVGTAERPVVHWFFVNVVPPTLTNGDMITEYLQPISPNLFLFLLFEQENEIENVNKTDYGIECPGGNFPGTRYSIPHENWVEYTASFSTFLLNDNRIHKNLKI